MKNRQGSTLIMVLMIFVVLSILATATLSFMVSENKQSIYQKDKIAAYYVARSGAEATEAAIMQIYDEEKSLLHKLSQLDEKDENRISIKNDLENIQNNIASIKNIPIGEFKDIKINEFKFSNNGEVKVILEKEHKEGYKNGVLVIKSTGKVRKNYQKVEKVIDENLTIPKEKKGFEYPIYASGSLEINSESSIVIEPKSNLACGKNNSNKKIDNIIDEIPKILYPSAASVSKMPGMVNGKIDIEKKFKEDSGIKTIENKLVDNWKVLNENITDISKLNGDTNYYINGSIKISNKSFNIGNKDKKKINIFATGDIEIKGNKQNTIDIWANIYSKGQIELEKNKEITINGNIYAEDELEIEDNNSVNIIGDIYCEDELEIEKNEEITINGNIFVTDEFEIEKNKKINIKGNIYSDSKEEIEIEENTEFNITGSIYTPRAEIEIEESTINIIKGFIISKNIEIEKSNIRVEKFKSSDIDINNPEFVEENIDVKRGYYR